MGPEFAQSRGAGHFGHSTANQPRLFDRIDLRWLTPEPRGQGQARLERGHAARVGLGGLQDDGGNTRCIEQGLELVHAQAIVEREAIPCQLSPCGVVILEEVDEGYRGVAMRRVVREVDAMDQAAVWPEHPLAFAEDGDQRVGRDVLEHRERHVRIDALIRKRESSRVGGRQILDAGEAHECGARAAEGEELVEAAAEPGARGVVSEEGDESLRCGAEGGQVIPHEGEPEIAMDIDRDHALSTQEPKAQRYVQPPAGAIRAWGARAIFHGYTNNYFVDLLWDRTDVQPEEPRLESDECPEGKRAFAKWVNDVAMPWLRTHVERVGTAIKDCDRPVFYLAP